MWIKLERIFGERALYGVCRGKPAGKIPLWKPRRRCLENIRMDLWGDVGLYVLVGETGGKETTGET
jgi:hypothetical protein